MTPILKVVDVGKSFPGVVALRRVSLETQPGEVHALVGENGAGKSTLVRIIAGAMAPDTGSIVIDDHPVSSFTPRHARERGIAVIHQERQIAPDLGVAENVLLGGIPASRLGLVHWSLARDLVRSTLETLGADIDLDARVSDLTAAEWQLLEIARALVFRARVVVMDEPTSSLGGREAARLFATIRRVRDSGASVIYVSHHLEEIIRLADRISVLRDGQLVATVRPDAIDKRGLAELIIGRPLPDRAPEDTSRVAVDSPPALELVDVVQRPVLGPVSITVRPGEIICVTGAVGSGRRELARIAAFVDRPDSGAVRGRGRGHANVADAVRSGIVFLPDDRKRDALFLGQTVLFNIGLGALTAGTARYRPGRSRRDSGAMLAALDVRASRIDDPIDQLSGGNQQKIVLGRWMGVGARVFVLDEPTAGVDVGARAEIYRLLREQVRQGAAVLAFSSDFEEIRELADRVIVLRAGRIAGEMTAGEITAEGLLAMQQAIN